MALDQREFVHRHRHGVRLAHLRDAGHAAHFHLAVLVKVDRLNRVVENRQSFGRSGSRHLKFISWGPDLRLRDWMRSPAGYGPKGLYWPRARKASGPLPFLQEGDSSLNIQRFAAKPQAMGLGAW